MHPSPQAPRAGLARFLAILGPNGAGKTTAVNILTTLLEPSSGKAFVDGHNVASEGMEVRRSIGYLPESVQFYDNLSLLENLLAIAISKIS